MSLSPFLIRSQIDGTILFKDLPETIREALTAIAEVRRFDAREVLVEEGEVNTKLYLLTTGRVHVWTSNEGVLVELKSLGAGDYFGEVGFLNDQPATATVEALEAGMALAFAGAQTKALLEAHPEVFLTLQQLTLHRAMDTISKISGDV